MAVNIVEDEPNTFFKLPDPSKGAFAESYVRSHLKKWDIAPNSQVYRFRYAKPFHKMDPSKFLRDFFNDPVVQETFQVIGEKGQWTSIGGVKVSSVDSEIVPASVVSMAHFDKVYEPEAGIVREGTEHILKCIDDVADGFTVSDMLRDMLLKEESENAELFTDAERSEFLFRVFQHMALGGSMCQFEDSLDAYQEVTKRIYKALLAVRKDAETDKIVVNSTVYAVKGVESVGTLSLFPRNSRQNFCYVCVDPSKRHITVWYHAYKPYW